MPRWAVEDLLLGHVVGPLHKSKQRDVGSAEAVPGRVVDMGVAVGRGTGDPDGGNVEGGGRRRLCVCQPANEESQEQEFC